MKIKLLLLFCLTALNSFSQSPTWQWAKSAGGSTDDYGKIVHTDANRNLYVAGNFKSTNITFGSFTIPNNNNNSTNDFFIVKYDSLGNVIWANRAGGSSNDICNGMCLDPFGNIYLIGYFQSSTITFGGTTLTNTGGEDIFIVKYDPTGNVVWAKKEGGSASDEGKSICCDNSGNVLISGYFNSPSITIGTNTLTNAGVGSYDIFFVKYDVAGNIIWAHGAGGTAHDCSNSITADFNDNIYLTGYFQSTSITYGNITLPHTGPTGYPNFFVVKLSPSGSALWANNAGNSTDTGIGQCIKNDLNGNVIVSGAFSSNTITFGTITLTNTGPPTRDDIFLVKYDSVGNVLWATKNGGTNSDESTDICIDASGNIYETGFFYSSAITFGNTTLTNSGTTSTADIYIAKYNSSGNVLWAKSAVDESTDYSWGICTDVSGLIYTTGFSDGNTLTLESITLTNGGGTDVFIAKLCEISAPIITANGPTTFCLGDSIKLNAGPGYTSYSWSNGATTQNITVKASGNYKVTVTNQIGCTASSSSMVSVITTPTFTVPPNSSYCNGKTVPTITFASVPNGASFSWTNSNTSIGIPSSGSGNIPSFPAVNTGSSPFIATIAVTATLSGCTFSTHSFTITINPSNNASFHYSDSIYCQLAPNPIPTVTIQGGNFISTSGLVFLNSSTGQINLLASTPNTYKITHIVGTVCPDSISTNIKIKGIARVNAGDNPVVCSGNPYTLLGAISGTASTIAWSSLGTGTFNDSTLVHAIYTPSTADIAAGSVKLTAITDTSVNGCGGPAHDTIALTFINCSYANGETTFIKSYNLGHANSVQQTSDGGYIITGNSSGGSGYLDQVSLIKTDVNGDTLWTRRFGSNNNQAHPLNYDGNCVRQTNDGGYIVACSINIVTPGGIILDSGEVALIKTDNLGNLLWSKHYGGASIEQAQTVSQTSDGGYLVIGNSKSFGSGAEDIYLLKVDTAGNILWTKTIGNSFPNFGTDFQETTDGGFIITGYEKNINNIATKVYLIKTDNSGSISWAKSYEVRTGYNIASALKQTPDGGYIVTGTTAFLVNNVIMNYKAFLIKTDSTGNEHWTKLYGTVSDGFWGLGISLISDGGYIVCGTCNKIAGFYPYLMKTNSVGIVQFEQIFSGNGVDCNHTLGGPDFFKSVIQTTDGGFAAIGQVIATNNYCSGFNMVKTDRTGAGNCLFSPLSDYAVSIASTVNLIIPHESSTGSIATNFSFITDFGAIPYTSCIASATVWPGDADHNSLVDYTDLLSIGIFYGHTGSVRDSISNLWQAFPSTNWGIMQRNGHDIKQVDCNGDGTIDANDTLAINLNFNLTHAIATFNNYNNERLNTPEIYFTTSNSTYLPGDWVNVDIMLGTSTEPVSDLYGIAFNINYDASLVQLGTETLTYTNSWFATPGTDAIKMSKIHAFGSTVYGAETRINHASSNGFGKIATFRFKTKTTISSALTMNFSYSSYVANDTIGNHLLFNPQPYTITIDPTATIINEARDSSGITISPNPFTLQTKVTFNEEQKNITIKIIDVVGKEVKRFDFNGRQLIIEKGEMKEGIYFLQITDCNKNVVKRKIIIQ